MKSEQPTGDMLRVFESGDEDEFFKRISAVAKSHPVYLYREDGTFSRVLIEISIENAVKK